MLTLGINAKRDLSSFIYSFVREKLKDDKIIEKTEDIEGYIFNNSVKSVLTTLEGLAKEIDQEEFIDGVNNVFGYYNVNLRFVDKKVVVRLTRKEFEMMEFYKFFNLNLKGSNEEVLRFAFGEKEGVELELHLDNGFIVKAMLRVQHNWLLSNGPLALDLIRSFVNIFLWESFTNEFFDFSEKKKKIKNALIENFELDGVMTMQLRIDM